MKANAPEKIYVELSEGRIIADTNLISIDSVEYTRTDAVIKKVCKFIRDNGSHYIDIINGQLVLKKSLITDLKNYMERR